MATAHLRQATQLVKPPHDSSGFLASPSSSTADVPPAQGEASNQWLQETLEQKDGARAAALWHRAAPAEPEGRLHKDWEGP